MQITWGYVLAFLNSFTRNVNTNKPILTRTDHNSFNKVHILHIMYHIMVKHLFFLGKNPNEIPNLIKIKILKVIFPHNKYLIQ